MLWTEHKTDYLGYLPGVFADSGVFGQLNEIFNQEIDLLKAAVAAELLNTSLLTGDEMLLERYEAILDFIGSGSIEDRRRLILARLRERPPLNGARLGAWLDALFGSIRRIEPGVLDFSVVIKYSSEGLLDEEYLMRQLRRILPANMLIELVYSWFEWQYALSRSWQETKGYTWEEFKKLPIG